MEGRSQRQRLQMRLTLQKPSPVSSRLLRLLMLSIVSRL
jgi:hypothetical protein